jgi:hypothetical protein
LYSKVFTSSGALFLLPLSSPFRRRMPIYTLPGRYTQVCKVGTTYDLIAITNDV